jgi:hypothetical protein
MKSLLQSVGWQDPFITISCIHVIAASSEGVGTSDFQSVAPLSSTVRSKIKKIERAVINTLQLATRTDLIQMSLK